MTASFKSFTGFPEDVVRMALWLLAPDLAESPAWILTREPTVDEDSQAAQLAMAYFEGFHGLATMEEKRHYISGVLAANPHSLPQRAHRQIRA